MDLELIKKIITENPESNFMFQKYYLIRYDMEHKNLGQNLFQDLDGIRRQIHNYLGDYLVEKKICTNRTEGRHIINHFYLHKLIKPLGIENDYYDERIFKILNK